MSPTLFLGLLGGLLLAAFVANWQFRRTRIPDVVLLLVVGLLLGPVFHVVEAAPFQHVTHVFGTLAIILILFEGGLELNLRETLRHFLGGLLLSVLSYLLSFGLVAVVVWWSLKTSWSSALLVGAVLGCTSSSIVLPILQQMSLRDSLKVPLILEASLGDVFAVLTVTLLLDFAPTEGAILGRVIGGLLWKMLFPIGLAVLAGLVWSRLLPVISEQRFWNVVTFAVVLLLFAGTEFAGASGLIAVLGFGLALSNLPGVDRRILDVAIDLDAPAQDHHLQVLAFHSELAFLVRTFFFVLLGVVVEFSGLRGYLLATVGSLGALFLARWVAVRASSRAWRDITKPERELILWIMPRGLITAVLAIQVFEQRGSDFAFLPALAFAIILITNLIVVFGSFRARGRTVAELADPVPENLG